MPHTHDHEDHTHDLGFAHDLEHIMGRRRLLSWLGGLGIVSLSAIHANALDFIALPWETAGPYPADGTNRRSGEIVNTLTQEGIIRTDLRTSFGALTQTADGLKLDVELTLMNAENGAPLEGHALYLWHCDTTGLYSLYDVPEANWLRGVGIADADGKIRFTTIFPGCYDGRWPHFHFEVFKDAEAAVSGEASLLTAQIALPEAECAEVYASDARYANGTRNLGRITLETDNVFADNTEAQLAQQTMALTGDVTNGFSGTVTIPVDFNAERSAGMAMPPAGRDGPPNGDFRGPPPDGALPPRPGE